MQLLVPLTVLNLGNNVFKILFSTRKNHGVLKTIFFQLTQWHNQEIYLNVLWKRKVVNNNISSRFGGAINCPSTGMYKFAKPTYRRIMFSASIPKTTVVRYDDGENSPPSLIFIPRQTMTMLRSVTTEWATLEDMRSLRIASLWRQNTYLSQ